MQQKRPRDGRLSTVRQGLLAGLSLAALTGVAYAQDANEDEIVVTGSRIRQNPLEAGRPILNLTDEDFERSGLTSIGDFLQRIPSSGGGLNSKVNSSGNFGNPPDGGGVGAGASEIDLRFLGSKRVLVLVDGLRWVNGSSASGVPGATDLNTIPAGAIERIEVLQDGASPIYGSDAIAGVVNFITKRRQDGFAASAQLGAFDDKDGETQQYEISFGASNDRTDIFFAAQYVHQNSVSNADRDISDFPVPTLDQCYFTCSSATPDARLLFTDPNTAIFHNITLSDSFIYSGSNPVYDPLNTGGGTDDFKNFTLADRFNFSPFNFLQVPSERVGFFTQMTHKVSDTINFRGKAVYNSRKSTNQAAPQPIFIGPGAGNLNLLDSASIDVTNPFNPFGFTLDSSNIGPFLARRFIEGGPRHFEQDVDTFYLSGTFDGEFDLGGRTVYWDANALWSQNDASQIATGIVHAGHLVQALGPVSQCTGSCVPFNFFGGPGSITQAMVDFVTFDQHDSSEQEIWDLSLNISSTLFDLPAGGVGFAAGYEHRDQSGRFDPDPVVAAGESADIPASPTAGSFSVDEVYGELNIPVLADTPFFEALDLSFAVRYSDYSTNVSATTFKAGARWQPVDDLTIRGGYTEGFRAATIGELFGTNSRFDATLSDPCSDMLGLGGGVPASAAVVANCIALGVPASGSYVQAGAQLATLTSGSTALTPEKSESWNVGFTYQPSWADNAPMMSQMLFELNYYDIQISNAIQAEDAQFLLNSCANTLDALACAAITRVNGGDVSFISNRLTNIGGIDTKGIDWRVLFDFDETAIGSFRVESLATYLIDFTETNLLASGPVQTSREGTVRGSPTFSYPEFKSTTTASWTFGDLRGQAVGRYISSLTEVCGDFATLPADLGLPASAGCSNPAGDSNKLGSKFYLDLAASYTLPWLEKRAEFTIGVNNILDTDPPACFSCQAAGYDSNTYDVPGQFGYVRLTFRP